MTKKSKRANIWVYETTKEMFDKFMESVPININQDDLVRIAIKNLKKQYENDPTIILSEAMNR